MKKGRFRFIVLMMSMALAGLVLLQAYWIKHDFDLKAKQFDSAVMQAMNKIVDQVEQSENLRLVVKNFITTGDSSVSTGGMDDSLLQVLTNIASEPPAPPAPPIAPPNAPGQIGELRNEINSRIDSYRARKNRKPTEEGMYYSFDSTLDIRIEKDVQQKEVYAFRLDEKRSFIDSLERLTEQRMQSRLQKLNSMMQKLTFQIVDPSDNLFDRISQRALDSIVQSELKNRDLNLAYSYGVYKQKKQQWVYTKAGTDSVNLKMSPYKLTLFPNDIFKRNEILYIEFHDKLNFLFGSILPLFLFSFLFTFIITWGFAYTLKVVLNQKKLADIKNDFINNMTHEFKTPIATIAIANETLRNPRVNQSPEKIELYTNIIRDENQRMLRQVETVLQMAQIDKGEIKLHKESVPIKELIESAISSMKLTVEQRGGSISFAWNAREVVINADPNHLLNVFINLLDNANKYSPENPLIAVSSYDDGNNIHISFTDNGIGMSKEVLKRIFDTFFRATSGNIHDVKGFGLGLSYVKAILNLHNGNIEVKSEPGKGSTFTVILPVEPINNNL